MEGASGRDGRKVLHHQAGPAAVGCIEVPVPSRPFCDMMAEAATSGPPRQPRARPWTGRRFLREDHLAVTQDGNFIAHLEDFLQVVGDVQHGHPTGHQGPHPVEQPTDSARSRAAVGSSKNRQRRPAASARAISTSWRCSTDRLEHGAAASTSSKPHSLSTRRVSARIVFQSTIPERLGWQFKNTFSATVSWGTTIECWKTVATRLRQASTSPRAGARSPSKSTWPRSASDPGHYRYESGLACPVAAHEAQAAAGAKGQADPTKGQCAAELLVDTDGLGGRDAVRRNGSFRISSHRFLPSAYIANSASPCPHPG